MHYRMFFSIPGFYPLDSSSTPTPTLRSDNQNSMHTVPNTSQVCVWGGGIIPSPSMGSNGLEQSKSSLIGKGDVSKTRPVRR